MAERKLGMLRRAGLFGDNTRGCKIQRACSLEDLRQAYRLVHDVYLETGFICPEPSGMRLRMFETAAETATFVAKTDGQVVAVLSVVLDSPDLGLPSDSVFKPELDRLRAAGARLAEVTNQAVAEPYRKTAVPTELMRCAIALLLKAGYNEAIAAVSPSHNGFYDLLGFRQIGSERSYSDKLHDPVIAVSMDVNQYRQRCRQLDATEGFIHDFLTESNQFIARVAGWANEAKQNFLDPHLLEQLFVVEGQFLSRCSEEELRILYRRWGRELFEAVAGPVCGKSKPTWAARFVDYLGTLRRSSARVWQHRHAMVGGACASASVLLGATALGHKEVEPSTHRLVQVELYVVPPFDGTMLGEYECEWAVGS
jgi:ribosomal protein S18 acetylase RimI-like enzyme